MRRHLPGRQAAALPSLVCAVGWACRQQSSGNFHPVVFHPVIAGELYRAALPTPMTLQGWPAQHGIRSRLNLRGPSGARRRRAKIAAGTPLSLTQADFSICNDEVLSPERSARLLAPMRRLPKPVLIHRKAGAGCSGLAAALYLAQRGQTEAAAKSRISFRYGHTGLPGSTAWPMDQS